MSEKEGGGGFSVGRVHDRANSNAASCVPCIVPMEALAIATIFETVMVVREALRNAKSNVRAHAACSPSLPALAVGRGTCLLRAACAQLPCGSRST